MRAITLNISEPELIAAVNGNYAAYFAAFDSLLTVQHHADIELAWIIAPSPPGSSVHLTQFDGDVDDRIERVLTDLRKHGATYIWWQVFPTSQPYDLGAYLLRQGLERIEPRLWMTADLQQPGAGLREVAGMRIERVGNERQLEDWYVTQWRGFGSTPAQAATYRDAYAALGYDLDAPHQCYVAYLDSQPVSGGTLVLASGIAGIYDVATDPAVRGKGTGSAVTAALMQHARRHGYRYAALQPSDEGYRLYQRLGFGERFHEDNYAWLG